MPDNRREIPPVSLIEQTDRNAAPHVWLQNSMVCASRYPLRRNNHFARTEITGQKSGANVRSPHSTEPFGLRSGNDRIGGQSSSFVDGPSSGVCADSGPSRP